MFRLRLSDIVLHKFQVCITSIGEFSLLPMNGRQQLYTFSKDKTVFNYGSDSYLTQPKSSENHRKLQKPKITTVYYNTDTPSMSPTRDDRLTGLIVCTAVQPDIVSLSTDVEFYLRVETDSSNSSKSDTMDVVSWVSGEAIKILATNVCDQLPEDSTGNRRLQNDCILSISSGTPDTRIISCDPEIESSKSCSWYRGSLRIVHKDLCSSEQIKDDVLNSLANVTAAAFLEPTNLDSSIKVTGVEFAEAPSMTNVVTSKSAESDRKSLTAGGTTLTVITGLVILAMVMLLLGRTRRRRNVRTAAMQHTEESAINCKDAKSDGSLYIGPNWRNIGSRHSSMDCHACNSLMCTLCHTHRNEVKMLQFDRANLSKNLSSDEERNDQGIVADTSPSTNTVEDNQSTTLVTDDVKVPYSEPRYKSIIL
jgi:hypothetical protein